MSNAQNCPHCSSAGTPETYLTTAELGARHHRSDKTLRNERSAGNVPHPHYVRHGRSVLYPLSAVLAYEATHFVPSGPVQEAA